MKSVSVRGEAFRQALGADADLAEETGESTEGKARLPGRAMPKPGDVIGHYELIRLLGKGGMGEVFLARDNELGRRVAIKFLSASDQEVGRRFIAEARATAACGHENIVVIYEADVFADWHFMVLEYLQGHPLSELLTGGQQLSTNRAVELIIPVVKALGCAHKQGIVHRDLKPDNIWVTESGTVKVLDFGIAKVMHAEPESTENKDVIGTMSYMSPEQWGVGEVDHRTDIWAVGLVLFRMLAGRHPLQGKHGAELGVTADRNIAMPSLSTMAPGVPAGLAQVVDRCLRKVASERYADAEALLHALEPFEVGRVSKELKEGETPYRGLASFQETDSGRFFGRNLEIATMVTKLRAQPLIGVVGSSGAGKSSFVRAGVVPALKRSGELWQAIVVRPSRRPLEVLVDALMQINLSVRFDPGDLEQREQLAARLRREPGYAGAAFRSHARKAGANVLLFIDQFEELYTQVSDPTERLTFTTCLSSIADDAASPVRVVLSIRADFLDRVTEDPRFMAELSQGLFFLSAPHRGSLAEALVQPAEMAGYRFESEEIVQDMLAHLEATQGALPLLQFTASKLWDARDTRNRLLTLATYRALGGIKGALAAHADSVLRDLSPLAQTLARTVLPRLVTPEHTRALVSVEELRELSHNTKAVDQLVNQLVKARLLMVQTSGGSTTVELVHESLISSWPLLRRWLDEGREDQAFREQLRTAARQWESRQNAQGLLWQGDALEEARLWRSRHPGTIAPREQEFLDAAFALSTRAQRTRQALVSGIIATLLILLAGGSVALIRVQRAEQGAIEQARVAEHEASRAKTAEGRVKEQLDLLRKEEAAKAQAEAEVQRGRGNLQVVNQQLELALEKARVESENARSSANKANELAGSLQNVNTSLSRLLAEERARTARLEQERKKITTELR